MLLYVVNSFSAILMNVPSIMQFDYIILDPIMVKKDIEIHWIDIPNSMFIASRLNKHCLQLGLSI
jgi:hypothetical protein